MVTQARLNQILDPHHLRLPASPRVLEIRTAPYIDSTGDEAIEVTVVIPNSTPVKERIGANIRVIEDSLHSALRNAGIELWPYFWFRTPRELAYESRIK